MEEKELQNELASIRSLMERSSKFISRSVLSGILAVVYALVGAGVVYYLEPSSTNSDTSLLPVLNEHVGSLGININSESMIRELLIALSILIMSIATAAILSKRQ